MLDRGSPRVWSRQERPEVSWEEQLGDWNSDQARDGVAGVSTVERRKRGLGKMPGLFGSQEQQNSVVS